MDFARSGMLGVVVICIALAGALFGAYLAGIDTEEYEVTAYKYLADMSGEFEYDQSPQYIEFDPNTNYIGYYSTDTGDAFPQDRVDFVQYLLGVNNYRINTDNAERSVAEVTGDTAFSRVATVQVYYLDNGESRVRSCSTENVTLSSFVENLDLDSDIRTVKFRSGQNYNAMNASQDLALDWVLFTVESSWKTIENPPGQYRNYIILSTYDRAQSTGTVTADYTVALSAQLDVLTGTVKLYADNDLKTYLAEYDASDIVLVYGDDGAVALGDSISIEAQGPAVNIYMDPTKGVALKD